MIYRKVIALITLPFLLIFFGCEKDKKIIPAPKIHLKMVNEVVELNLGDTLLLAPKITYNIDASYQWLVSDTLFSTEKNIYLSSKKLGQTNYKFIVQTPYGHDTMHIPVVTIVKIDFNQLELKANSFDTGTQLVDSTDGFISNQLFLPVNPQENDYWTGYALSNIYSKLIVQTPSPFAAFASSQKDGKFMVYNQPQTPAAAALEFENNAEFVVGSIDVANTQLAHLVMKYGTENGIRNFGGENNNELDWCKLIIEGLNAQGVKTDTVNFYLADYRFENKKKNYIVSDWTTVDLKKLGKVNKIIFSIDSSIRDEENHILTPQQFCLDNIKLVE